MRRLLKPGASPRRVLIFTCMFIVTLAHVTRSSLPSWQARIPPSHRDDHSSLLSTSLLVRQLSQNSILDSMVIDANPLGTLNNSLVTLLLLPATIGGSLVQADSNAALTDPDARCKPAGRPICSHFCGSPSLSLARHKHVPSSSVTGLSSSSCSSLCRVELCHTPQMRAGDDSATDK